jgi:hypothetical protein
MSAMVVELVYWEDELVYWEDSREEERDRGEDGGGQGIEEREEGEASSWRPMASLGGLLGGQRKQEVAHGALEASTHLLPYVSMKKTRFCKKAL